MAPLRHFCDFSPNDIKRRCFYCAAEYSCSALVQDFITVLNIFHILQWFTISTG